VILKWYPKLNNPGEFFVVDMLSASLAPNPPVRLSGVKPCGESRGHILPRNPPTVARIMGWLIIPFAIDIT